MRRLVLAISAALLSGGPASAQIPQRYARLWTENVAPLLERPVWQANTSRYDATTVLMVPLHAAFELNQPGWQQQFFEHFTRFVGAQPPNIFPAADELSWLQYDYLVSQFLVLAAKQRKAVPPGLPSLLRRHVISLWTTRPAWQWASNPFKGIKSRLAWKLKVDRTNKSYYRAIIDHEEYLFAIAADLIAYDRITGQPDPSTATLREILEAAHATYAQRITYRPDGGWLFQPGAWTDHPEYQYAGRSEKVAGMAPAPLRDVAEDVSHSFRFPLWLISLRRAARDSVEAAYYEHLLTGLDEQLFRHVVKPPTSSFNAYRLTNFMDGRNGVYRWQYSERGATWGYGPYQLSATFTLGWWAFLGTSRVHDAYQAELARFPFSSNVLATYFANLADINSPSGKPLRDPLGGFRELLLFLAVRLSGKA